MKKLLLLFIILAIGCTKEDNDYLMQEPEFRTQYEIDAWVLNELEGSTTGKVTRQSAEDLGITDTNKNWKLLGRYTYEGDVVDIWRRINQLKILRIDYAGGETNFHSWVAEGTNNPNGRFSRITNFSQLTEWLGTSENYVDLNAIVKVFQVDDFSGNNPHGYRTQQTFKNNVSEYVYNIREFGNDLAELNYVPEYGTWITTKTARQKALKAANISGKTTIVWSSIDEGSNSRGYNSYLLNDVENFGDNNTLLVSSLENVGITGTEYPHGVWDYAIVNTGHGLDHTIFVGAIDNQGTALVDQQDLELFIDNTIFASGSSTSQATPVVAAKATELLHENPNLTAVELKEAIFDLTVMEERRMFVGFYNDGGTLRGIYEQRTIRVLN